ncbi:Acg family FMN-binding oxidoreductase [Rhodococcus chondri]|uniref:Acg family FMN-binding oxidoreductase n=1 Tax=Rhodococcus chondri TaxID=3065941 RepID=UPI002E7AEF82|nr:hypothetical protein [Rhodococcus sp. CC-R104]
MSASRAPSLHNSQPWKWLLGSDELSLFSDNDRILPATDAYGRQMVLSCGAALHHLQIALAAHRWASVIERIPHPPGRQCLATIRFHPADEASDSELRLAAAIRLRRTERLPMTAPANPQQTLADLRDLTERSGVHLSRIGEHGRPALDDMSRRIMGLRRGDQAYQAELRWWTGQAVYPGGIPPDALPTARQSVAADREFPAGSATSDTTADQDRAAIFLLSTDTDSRLDWLRCGEALSAVLLTCTDRGLATCPVTHLTELNAFRTFLGDLTDGIGVPQVLVRVGFRTHPEAATATSRRPLSEILFREHPVDPLADTQ